MSPPTVPLHCPRCRNSFDYDYVPGASFTAFRLGRRRYLRCPLCHRFAQFDLKAVPAPGSPPLHPSQAFSDRRHFVRWLSIFLVPAVVVLTALVVLLPRPEPAGWVGVAGAVIIAAGAFVLVFRSSLPFRPPTSGP
jgi:hypothetical protein